MVLNAVVTKEKQINLEKNSPGSEISECLEHEVKSKIGNIFVNQKILEEYSGKIYEIDSYFYEPYRKKYKLMKMGVNIYYLELIFILLNIPQPQKLMKKIILTQTLFLKRKIKKKQKKFGCNFVRNNTSKKSYDPDYESSRIQTFISKFKDRKLKKLSKRLKELEDKTGKLTGQIIQ